MKNLKIKFGLFSLLAVLAVSIFLTACEQENIVPDSLKEVSTESAITYFTLSESFDNMSDEDFANYFESMSEEGVLNMAVEILEDNLEARGCYPAVEVYSYCGSFSWWCNTKKQKRVLKRQYCTGTGYNYFWTSGNCCYP